MGWFSKPRVQPQPREAREFPDDPVASILAEMNRLLAAEHRYKRNGSHITTNVILQDKQAQLWRKLVDEYDVLPVHDKHTGRWKLFNGTL